ncbi:MAG: hypothetical protein MK172_06085 [Verrucomicrobiales bacterium]|nr:hypothetical protein [Verrucomicrobiales bacterium]
MGKKKTATPKKGLILTEEILRARLTPITNFESVTPAAAEILAVEGHKYTGRDDLDWDSLEWLKNISNEVAVKLGGSPEARRSLVVDGLNSLSDEAAEGLSKFKGEYISLNGLTKLSDAAAESLSKHKGYLHLKGLTKLSDAAAESLSKYKGKLGLRDLTEITNTSLARKLASQVGVYGGRFDVDLHLLTALSDAAAEALCKFKGEVTLGSSDLDCRDLKLSDVALKSLSTVQGGLDLAGLRELSDVAAEDLSNHEGEDLRLNGLTKLSDAAAEALAKYKSGLFLNGIESLSDAAAETLAGRKKKVELKGLNELSVQGALSFSKNKLLVVSDQIAKRIVDAVKNHAKTSSTLTSKDQSKIRKLITSEDGDTLDFACNLLASLNASEGDWLKLFPKSRIQKLLSNWEEPKIWNVLATAMKPHARLYEELKLQAEKRASTYSTNDDVRQRYRDFLNDLIKVANNDVIALLSFATGKAISTLKRYRKSGWKDYGF